ncbi:MAG: Sec-independent protein translocase protein TatB [Paracoccaceae bacterium]
MFDIGFSELLVIGVVALIVVGPKDLPGMFRTVGRYVGKAKGMAREFQRSMEDAADATGLKDVGSDFKDMTSGLDDINKLATGGLDPKKAVKKKFADILAAKDSGVAMETTDPEAGDDVAAHSAEKPKPKARKSVKSPKAKAKPKSKTTVKTTTKAKPKPKVVKKPKKPAAKTPAAKTTSKTVTKS